MSTETAPVAHLHPIEAHPARYSAREELASSAIHAFGAALSVGALGWLLVAAAHADARVIASVVVYGIALIALYAASMLYHGIGYARAKPLLRVLDHAAIFLLIAGTYTPYALITLRGAWGWSLLAIVWTLALVGIGAEFRRVRSRLLMAVLYVGMGWIGLVAIKPLVANLAAGGLWLLFGGGAAYTLGVPFYLWKRLPYNHALWHVFVLLGSVLQFFSVRFYVLPGT